ncbi:MAG TPA: BNR repeat-containing protein [Polyangiaceae bacterium]
MMRFYCRARSFDLIAAAVASLAAGACSGSGDDTGSSVTGSATGATGMAAGTGGNSAASSGGGATTSGSGAATGSSAGAGPASGAGGNAASAGGASSSGGASGGGGATGSGGTGGASTPIAEVVDVADVWSGHPVEFALLTRGDRQFVAYYDDERRMAVAARSLGETTWTFQVLPTTLGWDSHNYVAMAADELGFLHVSGNMHNVPLIYFKSTVALDAASLQQVSSMVGTNESSVTYPEFFAGPTGSLIFGYRDGGSGNGNQIFNVYAAGSGTWSRLLDTPFTDGETQRNAYPVGPVQGPDGYWHLVWVWRDTPDASTNNNLSYARSQNLVDWETAAGAPLTLPITLAESDVVDPVQNDGGMINNNTKFGFDAENRPVIVYHKYDSSGNTQLYNARFESGEWVAHQATNWDYRWDFGGGGTLVFEIEVEGIEVQSDGSVTQRYYHAQYGGWGALRLDPVTLAAIETIDPPLPYPAALDMPESTTAGMVTRWQADTGAGPDPSVSYMLRWETLESNRDEPRDTTPPPTRLRLYGFRAR